MSGGKEVSRFQRFRVQKRIAAFVRKSELRTPPVNRVNTVLRTPPSVPSIGLQPRISLLKPENRPLKTFSAFTLFEVILALAILAIFTGAIYSVASAAIEASKATLAERSFSRRLESFLGVTRDAFLCLPREGRVHLRFARAPSGAPVPELIFEEAAGVFGIPSLGGGSLALSARPMADGSRTLSVIRIPKDTQGQKLQRLTASGAWIPLLPHVESVKWTFLSNGQWREEWLPESGRPLAARLQMKFLDMPGSKIDAQFWIPPLLASSTNVAGPTQAPIPAPAPPPNP